MRVESRAASPTRSLCPRAYAVFFVRPVHTTRPRAPRPPLRNRLSAAMSKRALKDLAKFTGAAKVKKDQEDLYNFVRAHCKIQPDESNVRAARERALVLSRLTCLRARVVVRRGCRLLVVGFPLFSEVVVSLLAD